MRFRGFVLVLLFTFAALTMRPPLGHAADQPKAPAKSAKKAAPKEADAAGAKSKKEPAAKTDKKEKEEGPYDDDDDSSAVSDPKFEEGVDEE